jgi:hypothetical protein
MKKVLFFLLLAAGFFTACGDDEGSSSRVNDKDSSISTVYKQILKGIETGDSALLARYFDKDATLHGANSDGTDITGDSLISMLAGFKNDMKDLKLEIIEEATNDDHFFAVVRMTGINPAGNKMDSKTVDITKVKNGKATDIWSYIEHGLVMRTMTAEEAEHADQ